jgi:hypothetical protein
VRFKVPFCGFCKNGIGNFFTFFDDFRLQNGNIIHLQRLEIHFWAFTPDLVACPAVGASGTVNAVD